ncbi:hypothetical protein ABHN11_31220 [Brevibacillus centrosporus]|uniref:hypothetical protein n=1 Tax=Brevibacillus centrosporus TaxID=54910 RepID=UPI003986C506
MSPVELSRLSVSHMVEGEEYVFTNWFFTDRLNENTIIKKEGCNFYVTYSGGEFEQDKIVIFTYDSFNWYNENINVARLTLSDLEEASVELYNLFMSDEIDEKMKEHVQVI